MHIFCICRLTTAKARDKLQALLDSESLTALTLIRPRPTPLSLSRSEVRLEQYPYAAHLPENAYDHTPFMRLKNHILSLTTAYRVARKSPPDVFYGIFLVPYGLFAWLLSRWFRRPCILSLIGTDLNDYTLRYPTKYLLLPILRRTALITVVDEDARQRLIAAGIRADQVMILPSAVDLAPYMAVRETPKDIAALFSGRLLPMKEPERLLTAWAKVVKQHPTARLVLLGDGVLKQSLTEQAAQLGIADHIDITGWVAADSVPSWVGRASLFVSASSQEGVPTALLEAMAAGCVPVHTAVGGVPSVIQHGVNGMLVESPADPEQIAAYLLTLLDEDNPHYATLRAEALKVAQTHGLPQVTAAWNMILERMENHVRNRRL